MDPTRPARASPRRLHDAIARFGVTQLFGSPALIAVLAKYGKPLKGVKRITSAGAPVPAEVVARMRELMDEDAQLWTPYGATECLPVAVIEARELETTRELTERGAGTCVGRPVPPNRVRIIGITDAAIPEWHDGLELPSSQLGEITVVGPFDHRFLLPPPGGERAGEDPRNRPRRRRSASCIAWVTWAGSTTKAGCGFAGASRSAC
jgi:acyl-coenzyme A synthetase/AMP-(fatty) acid ligase